MQNALPIITLLVGLVVGTLVGYIWAAQQNRRARLALAGPIETELRSQVQQRENELSTIREKLYEEQRTRVAAETNEASASARLVEQQEQQSQALADLKTEQEKSLANLREAFSALSAQALAEAQPKFLQLANENFAKFAETSKGDLLARQEAISGIITPLKEQLNLYQSRLQTAEQEQAQTLGKVRQQLESLQNANQTLTSETNQLRRVLSSSQARGRWGEETLRRVVEAAGMSAHCDFVEQTSAEDSRPDLLVMLPGDRQIIVDSKVPDLDFLDALGSVDNASRATKLASHAAKLKATVQLLASREYPKKFPSALDKVVLFVPAESLLSAALEGNPNLIVESGSLGILLATPSSLIALFYAVAMSWQQDAQTRNARALADAGIELFERVNKFVEHFVAVRDGLEKTSIAYNRAVASFESRVRPSGDRLVKLAGSAPDTALPEAQPVQSVLRTLPDGK